MTMNKVETQTEEERFYNVLGIPQTMLIGSDGRIVAKGLRDVDLEMAVARLVESVEQDV